MKAGRQLGGLRWLLSALGHVRGSLIPSRNDADAVITIDEDTRVVLLNPAARSFTGLGMRAARGRLVGELLRDFTDQTPLVAETVLGCLKHRRSIRLPEPVAWQDPLGRHHALRLTVTPAGAQGEGAVLVLEDITRTLAIPAALEHEATRDHLTGLPNRTLLLDRLRQAQANARRQGSLVALLFVHLDRSQHIHDSRSPAVGDRLLQRVAERLTTAVRSGDTVARWSDDEFVILMDGLHDRADVAAVANKLLELLEREVDSEGGTAILPSCSIGISVGPADSENAETLLALADKAMYRGKLEGSRRYTFYSDEMNTWSRERLSMEAALRNGLDEGEFELFYQPQIDILSGRLVGLESLLRWRQPANGLLRPDRFIPAAEESGIIRELGEWVIHEATRQLARWSAAGLNAVPLAINLSARQCSDMSIVDTIRSALDDSGVDPRQLKVELTEATAMGEGERVAEVLRGIHDLGVVVAVDDFGTAYSSLSLLRRLPISELKIDRRFVGDIGEDRDEAAIVHGSIALAQSLGMKVVAEGVETERQLRFLARYRCNVAQGFLFAQPLPASEICNWLRMPPPHAMRAVMSAHSAH